jgi:four helix bundle protein
MRHASPWRVDDTEIAERPASFEDGQDIRDRAFVFACRVVKFCQKLNDAGGIGRLMVPQLVSCTLSFATMLEEARGGESDADFISKCSISLKECRESWTRLRVCVACHIGPSKEADALVREANELIAIVTTIIRNKRRNVAAGRSVRRTTSPRSHEFQIPNS